MFCGQKKKVRKIRDILNKRKSRIIHSVFFTAMKITYPLTHFKLTDRQTGILNCRV